MAEANPHILSNDVKECEHCQSRFERQPGGDKYYFRKRRFCGARCAALATKRDLPLIDRLFSRVVKGNDDECWLWKGGTTKAGYGIFGLNGRLVYSHRVSYEMHKGSIPPGLSVCHQCDTPLCVNPAHLFIGTQSENHADMVAKGRHRNNPRRGAEHHSAKLTPLQVKAIRRSSASTSDLAKRYGLAWASVDAIIRRKTWRHI